MYIGQILEYLILPCIIIISWLIIKNALVVYEKKNSDKE